MVRKQDNLFFLIDIFIYICSHGGAGAAKFCEQNIINCIENTSEWKRYVSDGAKNPEILGQALCKAFEDLDDKLRKHQEDGGDTDSSGCTANTVMITPTHVVCANAGDSRCVLSTLSEVKAMSIDHKPTDELEKKRIQAAGGTVHMKRVDGDLAVSRTLGDFAYKNRTDLPAAQQKVSPVPDIVVHQRTAEDEFVLLACDGVWDVLSNEEAVTYTRSIFASGENDIVLVAEEIVDYALEKNSRDNISAVIAVLPGLRLVTTGGGVLEMRAKREAAKKKPNTMDQGIDHSG